MSTARRDKDPARLLPSTGRTSADKAFLLGNEWSNLGFADAKTDIAFMHCTASQSMLSLSLLITISMLSTCEFRAERLTRFRIGRSWSQHWSCNRPWGPGPWWTRDPWPRRLWSRWRGWRTGSRRWSRWTRSGRPSWLVESPSGIGWTRISTTILVQKCKF